MEDLKQELLDITENYPKGCSKDFIKKIRLRLFVLLLIIFHQCYSQISVSKKDISPKPRLEGDLIQKFKNTETIFVLSKIYDRAIYENILNDSWDVTPFKIVSQEEFNIENYLDSKYSVARLSGGVATKITKKNTILHTVHTYIDIRIYDKNNIVKKLAKLKPNKKFKKKAADIILANSASVARFLLYPNSDFIRTALSKKNDEIIESMYLEDVFYNYKPGFLKNYFQKINRQLKDEKVHYMGGNFGLPELKELRGQKLYIPSYINVKYDGWKIKDTNKKDEYIEKIFRKYEYPYEIISDEDLSDKIINEEELYYLRYTRKNNQHFLEIVKSVDGEIIFRLYDKGLFYKIKPKHIKVLSSDISKSFNN